MKILKIVVINLLIFLLLIFVGLSVFFKVIDVNKYLLPITQQMGHMINRQVNIGHAGLGLHFPLEVSLDLQTLTISDDPHFSQKDLPAGRQDFLIVDKIHLGLEVMPLLLKREVHVTGVKIVAPRVFMIRLANGQINAQTMVASPAGTTARTSIGADPPAPSAGVLVSPKKVSASTLPSGINLPLIFIKSIVIHRAQISFQDQNPQLPLNILIQDIDGRVNNFSLTEPFVVRLQAHMGDGEIDVETDIHDLLTAPQYNFRLQIKDIKIEDCLDESHWPALFKGRLAGELQGSGQSFEPQMIQENLKAHGELSFTHARIEKLNILKSILSKLDFIPGLSSQIEGALSSGVKDKLGSDTTILNKAQIKISIEDKILVVDDTQLESNIFSLTAQGTVGFDLTTKIDVRTYLAADLSKELTSFVKPLRGLLDDQGRLYIPGRITGHGTAIGYQPDVDYISKKVIVEEGAQQINKQLEKVLNKNPVVKDILNAVLGGGQSGEQSTNPSDQNQERPAQKLINNVLKNILR